MTPSRTEFAGLIVEEHIFLRAVDLCLAGIGLVLLSPVMIAVGLVVAALSRRSPFVSHLRVGKSGVPFWMLKFRTMWDGRPARNFCWVERLQGGEPNDIKPPQDPRVRSGFARFCRTYSLDELPQLLHALSGRMSLVGPRPLTSGELDRYYGPSQAEILAIAPGLTGLWQIKGRNALTYRERVRFDRFLARNYSWRLYWYVLVRTIPLVLSGKGAW
ncbi:MAG: sugar transferase [Acidobacteria bacterium]|nr:sugar transferase [Acidobacteriota bacterium]